MSISEEKTMPRIQRKYYAKKRYSYIFVLPLMISMIIYCFILDHQFCLFLLKVTLFEIN